jgi:polyhydroxyalkanoate synthesis regulator phasin
VSEPIRWTRAALEARLDALEQKHTGQKLIDAIVAFAGTLTDEDKRLFQEVLLKRRRPAQLRLPRRRDPESEER